LNLTAERIRAARHLDNLLIGNRNSVLVNDRHVLSISYQSATPSPEEVTFLSGKR